MGATRVVLLAENDDGATESRMERAFLKALKGGKGPGKRSVERGHRVGIWLDVIVLKVQHIDMQKELAAAGGLDKLFPTDTWPQVGGAHVRVVRRVLGLQACVSDQRSSEDCYEGRGAQEVRPGRGFRVL